MLKICYLCSNYVVGGFEKMVQDLFLNLDKNRFDTTVCLLRSKGKFIDMMLQAPRGQVHLFDLSSPYGVFNTFRLMRFLRSGRFDVIHAFGLKGDLITRMMKLLGLKAALVSCVANPDYSNSLIKALTNKISGHLTDTFWADCRFRAADGVKRSNIPQEKIRVIYAGLDAEYLRHEFEDGNSVKQELNIPFDSPVIGSVGDLRFIKGHHLIIKAAPLILQEFPSTVFIFVGSDFTKGELHRLAQETGFGNHFHFVGFRFDSVRFISAMDVLLQPSLSEGLPRALLEAMSMSKPVIASSVGGIPEIIRDEVNGCLVSPNDPEILAERTCKVLANPSLKIELGKQAYETVKEKFSLERMLQEFESLYESLAHFKHRSVS